MPPTQPPVPLPDQNTVSPASYQLPPVAPVSHQGRNIALISIGVVIALVAIGAAVFFFTPLGTSLQERFIGTQIPQELRAAAFVSDQPTGVSIIYHFQAYGKAATEDAGAALVSAVQDARGSARITRVANGTFMMYLDGKVIQQDTHARIGIDRAPDGKSVVYAQASSTMPFLPPAAGPTLNISRTGWNVIVFTPSTGPSIHLGAGVSPFFIDQTHVAWLAPAGLAVIDLSTQQTKILVPDVAGRGSEAMLVSPDHSVFAWYEGKSKTLMPYKVTPTTATALPKTLVPDSLRWVALGNDSLYELDRTESNTQILKQAFGAKALLIGHFTASTNITRLWLGSI
jgi:hypothetical protein